MRREHREREHVQARDGRDINMFKLANVRERYYMNVRQTLVNVALAVKRIVQGS